MPRLCSPDSLHFCFQETQGLGERNLSQFERRASLFPFFAAMSAIGGFDSHAAIRFSGSQITNAKFRQILLVTLINLLDGEVGVVYFVLSGGHILGVIRRGR